MSKRVSECVNDWTLCYDGFCWRFAFNLSFPFHGCTVIFFFFFLSLQFYFNFHFNFSVVLFRCLAEGRTQWKRRTRLKKNSNSESHVTTSVSVCGFFVVHFESWSFTVYCKHNRIGHGSSSSSSQYSAYKIAIKQLVGFSKTNCCSSRFISIRPKPLFFVHTHTLWLISIFCLCRKRLTEMLNEISANLSNL